MTISLQQFCLLLFEPKILRGKYPAMFVSENNQHSLLVCGTYRRIENK